MTALLALLGVGALGAAALWPRRRQVTSAALQSLASATGESAEALTQVSEAATSAAAPNLTLEEGETFSVAVRAFFAQLAAKLPSITIYVTDGTRTARDQALAMLAKAARYDAAQATGKEAAQSDDLRWLYQQNLSVVEQLLASGRDADTWTDIIQAAMDRGVYISRHLRGGAADVRTRDHSAAEVTAIREAATALGAETILESDHLHIQIPV